MDTYGNELRDLGVKMQSMEILQRELEVNEANVRKAALEMETERKKKDALLASIRRERDTYNDMIKQLEVSSERLRNMMKDLEDKELPSSVTGKGFGALKNRLPWPVAGSVIAPYGKYTNPEFNIPTFRKGVEIKADIGDMVLAAASGKVVYADFFKGYGLLLIINHGDGYHTLYAHLSEIFPKTGDIIKDRQSVGKIGESGILNDPSLYFEIRHKGKPLNPLEWLSRK
ncbi:MAG: peptidoglycan DD-metalloendopeptidase family protein [Nitrospirae bacterium]|nr:peptidoglycan DD-metalloendopeptidase family protein [Nitrospirota bacterium]